MGQEDPPDCTERCRSTIHGDVITSAISRRSVSDLDLCSFLNHICTCCESVRDAMGRTALHVAASCGRIGLVRWLVQNRHANINAKDEESGFTALHRSVFYGKIHVAVELIKLGANVSLLDQDSLTSIEHAMNDGFVPDSSTGELYVWGSNSNNSLGPQTARTVPEILDVFHKKYPNVTVSKVCLENFHSVIISSEGKVYSCGHGQGGRLGLGHQKTVMIPEPVAFPEHGEALVCVDAAISRDHSLFLTLDGNIFSCGLNTHRVLGLRPPPNEALIPMPVKQLVNKIKGVCAGPYHSLAWGSQCLYTWGLNAGQLGHKLNSEDKYITSPKLVTMLNLAGNDSAILAVDSSDAAVTVYTTKGDIYVLQEYQCRKIASRCLNVVQVSIIGGKLNASLCKELTTETSKELKVVALTNTGDIFLWQESLPHLLRCIYTISRPTMIVKQVALNSAGLLFVTREGEAFEAFIKPRKRKLNTQTPVNNDNKSAFHKFLDKDDCIVLKITKIAKIHRAIRIESDTKGKDFCAVQVLPYKRFDAPKLTDSEMVQNLKVLLEESHENDDLHDVIFKVDSRFFPAHRLIIAAKSQHFKKLFIGCDDRQIELKGYNPLIFEQFLNFVYTGTCDLMKIGECPDKLKPLCEKNKSLDENQSAFAVYKQVDNREIESEMNKIKNPVRMLHEMAKKFDCSELCTILSNYDMHMKYIIKKKTTKEFVVKAPIFDRFSMSELYDVTIKCSDGKQVQAHKCILASQCDYFNNLFSTRWHGNSTSVITLPTSKSNTEALLEFLYTDSLTHFSQKDQDQLFKLIVLADQLWIIRLKHQCEFLLHNCLTLKNCVQLLSFANIYNADKLKDSCLKFIISNMAPLLELRMFDELDETVLKELSDFYFEHKKEIGCRVITPYSTAPTEEEILFISNTYPVSLDEVMENRIVQKTKEKRNRVKHRNQAISLESSHSPNTSKENEPIDNVIQFSDSPDINTSCTNVTNRLKAIKLAKEKLDEDEEEHFTKLVSKHSDEFSTSFEEFPLLTSSPLATSFHGKSPHKSDTKHKLARVSQKQRKRLSTESISESPTNAESPKNPWKIVSEVARPSPPETSMEAIINSEKKQKENLIKIRTKLLIYTQIEDKAIEELSKFYNAEESNDEFITVDRVALGAVATPVWVPGVKKLES